MLTDLVTDKNDKNYGEVLLTVNLKPLNRVFDTDLHSASVREHLKPSTLTIAEPEGSLMHTFEMDGVAHVCIQAKRASKRNPMAIGFRVETSHEVTSLANLKASEGQPADVDSHLTHMETELERITAAMGQLLHEADLNKDQDERFHEQTIEMVKATTFWPIVQVCVLVMTGFTQASHIIRFFKTRRII